MRQRLHLCLFTLALLAGCAGGPISLPGMGDVTAVPEGPIGIESEQRRLARYFDGTPVVFEMEGEGRMRVEVPLRYSFEPGRWAVKPPLGAVLDKLAQSQRLQSTRFTITAPADKPSGRRLAEDRAASTRDYLIAQGIAAIRFTSVTGDAGADAVVIRVSER